jgi:hypothetical protein
MQKRAPKMEMNAAKWRKLQTSKSSMNVIRELRAAWELKKSNH